MIVRKITEEALDLIKSFEGFRAKPYFCQAGYPTIGYGHVIRSWEKLAEVDEAQATLLLSQDVKIAERSVCRLIAVPLTDGQYGSLVIFTFNVGGGALQRSTLRQKVNRNEHHAIPEELMKWVWAGGKKSAGLMRRRMAEALFYVRGVSLWVELDLAA